MISYLDFIRQVGYWVCAGRHPKSGLWYATVVCRRTGSLLYGTPGQPTEEEARDVARAWLKRWLAVAGTKEMHLP